VSRIEESEIDSQLEELPGWSRSGTTIEREYRFGGFGEAIAFVNRVAELADAADHHPDIDIRYDRVRLSLTTHDSGGLTERDFALARRVDA
jgi:4a-hydroxytetrahydrobiopterin dehydratase